MEEKYKIIYKQEPNLYLKNSPVIITAGALVFDSEKRRLLGQLKFKNISSKPIILLKAKLVLMDSVGRKIGEVEKQYLDLRVGRGGEFGAQNPILIEEKTTRKILSYVTEVCFSDGSVYSSEDCGWTKIPDRTPLNEKFYTSYSLDEYKTTFCKNAFYEPLEYENIWVCSCGSVNGKEEKNCYKCNSNLAEMKSAEKEEFHNRNVYSRARQLVEKDISSEIEKGISLFCEIINYSDVAERVNEAKAKLELVQQKEKEEDITRKKRVKKFSIISLVSVLAVTLLIVVISIISTGNMRARYDEGKSYLENNQFTKAEEVFDSLGDYEDSLKLCSYSYHMKNKDFASAASALGGSKFTIPSSIDGKSVTEIPAYEFLNDYTLKEITIPSSVTEIGAYAFKNSSIEKINLPSSTLKEIETEAFRGCDIIEINLPDSLTKIGESAFESCGFLKTVSFSDDSKLETIGSSAFRWSALQNFEMPSSVKTIGAAAFASTNIKNIVIPNGVIKINVNAFNNTPLADIVISSSVTAIENGAFYSCELLKVVYFKGGATQWNLITIGSSNSDLVSCTKYYDYDGAVRTYEFNSNGGTKVINKISDKEIILPTPTKANMYFGGWYDNSALTGVAYKDRYYSTTKTALYAKWLTAEEYALMADGTSFTKAITISTGSHTVNINSAGSKKYLKFVPSSSRTYTIKSTGGLDTYGEIYNSTYSKLKYNDGVTDFSMSYYMTAGETYYIVVKLYSTSATGSFIVQVS